MKLFVGLGNPGSEHARQRHNVGFMAVERIAERHGLGAWNTCPPAVALKDASLADSYHLGMTGSKIGFIPRPSLSKRRWCGVA